MSDTNPITGMSVEEAWDMLKDVLDNEVMEHYAEEMEFPRLLAYATLTGIWLHPVRIVGFDYVDYDTEEQDLEDARENIQNARRGWLNGANDEDEVTE